MNNLENFAPPDSQPRLLVCAASARWLTESSTRAGFEVISIDRFGDWDLRERSSSFYKFETNEQLYDLLLQHKGLPLLIGTELETSMDCLDIFTGRPEWCNSSPASIRASRDPFRWTQMLRESNLAHANISQTKGDPEQALWVNKSNSSIGGMGVAWQLDIPDSKGYWQEYIAGQPISSLHLSDGSRLHTLGIFIQLIGSPFPGQPQTNPDPSNQFPIFADPILGAAPFAFAGAIGPLNANALSRLGLNLEQLERSALKLSEFTGLRGGFGIDWILDSEQKAIPIEINPRLTSTAELWERSTGRTAVELHFDALNDLPISISGNESGMKGKVIAFNRGPKFTVSNPLHEAMKEAKLLGQCADVPMPQTIIKTGEPIATLFADDEADNLKTIQQSLVQKTQRLRDQLS